MALPRAVDPKQASRFLMLATVCVTVAALYFAQEVLIPIALAILFSFLLAPLVRLLERAKFPRPAAVIVSVLLAFSAAGGIGFIVYNQLADLTGRLPQYAEQVQKKIAGMNEQGGMLAWVHHTTDQAKHLLAPTSQPATAPAAAGPSSSASALGAVAGDALGRQPQGPGNVQRVEVVNQQGGTSPLAVARSVAGEVLGPAGTAFIVVVFTIFMLLQREDLRDRMIRLVGRQQLTTTTQALDDAATRVSKYLLLQSIVNGTVGLIVWFLLWLLGKLSGTPFPSPALWGLLATLLRFIPYVGIWISAVTPALLSLAVFTSFKWTFATLGVYLVTELVTANAIEPMLFGSSTGIGTLAVLVAAAFWTWLWGPVGLLLSTPLTVCLVVMGKYVPALEFLSVLLSDEPALSPPDRVYQRLLAQDQEEASDLIHEYARTMPVEELYDTVLLPALMQAELDSHHGGLTAERRASIHHALADVIDELGDQLKEEAKEPEGTPGPLARVPAGTRVHLPDGCLLNVVCLPAHDETDAMASRMLAQLLEVRGYCVKVVSPDELASEMVEGVEAGMPDAVIISSLPPAAVAHARYLCKRLHGKVPGIQLIVGLWTSTRDLEKTRGRLACSREVQLASGLRQAIGQLHEIVQPKLIDATIATKRDE